VRKELGGADDATGRAANGRGPFEARVVGFGGGGRRLQAVGASDTGAGPERAAELAGPPEYGAALLADDRAARPQVPLDVPTPEAGEASGGRAMGVSGDRRLGAQVASERAEDVVRPPEYGAAPLADDRAAKPQVPLDVPTPEAGEASGGRAMGVTGDRRLGAEGASERAEDVVRPPEYGAAPLTTDRDAEPDVLLDVPTLKVEEITLEVADLRARVSLNAEVLDLLRLHVGADVGLGKVNLGIKGVEAQALLKVRLDNVAAIISDVLQTIDNNPQLLENITTTVARAVDDVGTAAGRAVGDIGTSTGEAVSGAVRGLTPGIASAATGGVASTAQKVGETAAGLAADTPAATRSVVRNTTAAPSPPLPDPPVHHDPTAHRPPERKAATDAHPSTPQPTEPGDDQTARTGEPQDRRQPETGRPADGTPGQASKAAPGNTDRQDEAGGSPQEAPSDLGRRRAQDADQDAHEESRGEAAGTERPQTRQQRPERPEQPDKPERPEHPGQPGQPGPPDKPDGDPQTARPPSPALGPALRELGRAAGRAGLRKLRDLRR